MSTTAQTVILSESMIPKLRDSGNPLFVEILITPSIEAKALLVLQDPDATDRLIQEIEGYEAIPSIVDFHNGIPLDEVLPSIDWFLGDELE